MEKNNHLITQDVKSLILKIAIPSSIGLFFNTMYNVVDTYYAGTLSTLAISALSYSFMVYFMFLSVSFGLSSALTVFVGNALGKHRQSEAKLYVSNGIGLLFLFSLLLLLLGFLFIEKIFILVGAKEELALAMEYTSIILLGIPAMLLGLGANATLVALGDTKSYRNTLIVGFFLNIILTPLFLYGINGYLYFGFKGIALTTILVQYLTLVYMAYKLLQTKLFIIPKLNKLKININIYKNILQQGFPISLNMAMNSLGTLILTYYISDFGYKAMAAFGIGFRVEQIVLLPMLGLNIAVATLIANNYGAKNFDRIHETIRIALRYGLMMSFIGLLILVLFGKNIISIFDNDQDVLEITYTYIVFEGFILFAYLSLFINDSTLQGIKKPIMIPFISLYRKIIMPFILLFLLVKILYLPIESIWIAMLFIIYSSAIFHHFYTKKQLKTLQNSFKKQQ